MRRPSTVPVFVLAVAALAAAAAASAPSRPAPPGPPIYGGFAVEALAGGFWQPAGELRFGSAYGTASLVLPDAALASPLVRVRLVQQGGGAAHIDRVDLGGTAPLRLAGASEPGALAFARAADDDVLDAFGRTIELTFPRAGRGAALELDARVEGEAVVGSPFAFPPENQFQEVTAASAFYPFVPAPGGRAPAWPEGLEASRAIFAVPCSPTTGHPAGSTYGWVANDGQKLFAALEFTPDNTRDGTKDWASLHVARGGEVREFRVSEGDTRWGRPLFGPSPRAGYRHKTYLFEVPFSELGLRGAAGAGELKVAFSAYGTAAITWLTPNGHSFGSVLVGTTSAAASFTITNTSGSTMVLGTPWFTRGNPSASPFPIAAGTCGDGVVLAPSQSCSFQATFAPASVGPVQDTLLFYATIGTAPQQTAPLFLSGSGLAATAIPALGGGALAALALALAAFGARAVARG